MPSQRTGPSLPHSARSTVFLLRSSMCRCVQNLAARYQGNRIDRRRLPSGGVGGVGGARPAIVMPAVMSVIYVHWRRERRRPACAQVGRSAESR
jgi:hypothetical protein